MPITSSKPRLGLALGSGAARGLAHIGVIQILEENETVRTVILDELRPNDSIADSVFEFVPPEGTDVFEG